MSAALMDKVRTLFTTAIQTGAEEKTTILAALDCLAFELKVKDADVHESFRELLEVCKVVKVDSEEHYVCHDYTEVRLSIEFPKGVLHIGYGSTWADHYGSSFAMTLGLNDTKCHTFSHLDGQEVEVGEVGEAFDAILGAFFGVDPKDPTALESFTKSHSTDKVLHEEERTSYCDAMDCFLQGFYRPLLCAAFGKSLDSRETIFGGQDSLEWFA